MAETETVKPGDCIVFKGADSVYDVCKIDQAENRVSVRRGIKELSDAYEIARKNLEGGRVLYSDHSTPDEFEKYRFSN